MTLGAATRVDADLRETWESALAQLREVRGGPELIDQAVGSTPDPLGDLVASRSVLVERRGSDLVGFAVVRDHVIVALYVAPDWRGRGVARAMAAELFALDDPPRDALALPGDRATKSLYESLGLKARLLTMRAE